MMKHKTLEPRHHSRPRKTVLVLLAVFLLPVILAWLTLKQGWFTPGVNSHGEWVQGQISDDKQWRLILPITPDCATCTAAVPLLNNIDTALGRDSDRVAVVQLPASQDLEAGYVYIADPPGLLIMRYALPDTQVDADKAQSVMGKALLSDLRRLLKYSRAG